MPRIKNLLVPPTLILFGAYLASGTPYAFYSPERSNNYLWGVYHVHSNMSDGLLPPEEIARQARAAGVSLVLLTDHGSPNLESSVFRKIIDGVAIVGGSESQLPDGHLTFFGARELPRFNLSSFPPAAMDDARTWGAFPVLAYPEDPRYGWRYWEADLRPSGIEILNLFTCLRSASMRDKILLTLYYPFSRYYFLKSVSFSAKSIARWDEFLQRGKTWGLVATDAHGGFHAGKWLTATLPSYEDAFSFVALGINRRYSAEPEMAIRNGDFFNCVRGAGEPLLFEFFAAYGVEKFRSGSNAPAKSDLHVKIRTSNHEVRLVLKKGGVIQREIVGDSLDLPEVDPGVYRVECYLLGHPLLPSDVPWILSNPIFVGDSPRAALTSLRSNRSGNLEPF